MPTPGVALTRPHFLYLTNRVDALPCHLRVAVLGRVDLPPLPGVIHPPCDRLRSMVDLVDVNFSAVPIGLYCFT